VGVHLISDVARWAGAAAVVSFTGCVIAGVLGVQLSASVALPADRAFDLARRMALLGGACVLVAGSTSTLYYWLCGIASDRAAALVGVGLLAAALMFAGLARVLCERRRRDLR
jgi:hypothetical protein